MADKRVSVKKRSAKKTESVRDRAAKAQGAKPRRIRNTAGKLTTPIKKVRVIGKKEYHMPLPSNKLGRILGKRVRFPKFLREAWAEIKLVSWPNRRDTMRLTMAVFIFSIIFGVFVGVLDFGLDKIFKNFILN